MMRKISTPALPGWRLPGWRLPVVVAAMLVVTSALVVFTLDTAHAAPIRYEAENAPATCDGLIESNHTGFSGTGFCNANNAVGATAGFTITVATAGTATVGIRYANGTTQNRTANIIVNGAVVHPASSFPGTGAWASWATSTVTVPVNAGSNTVVLNPTTSNGLGNIDYLDIEVGDGQPPPGARQMEALDRGVVSVRSGNGNLVSWRFLGTDPPNVAFNLYRGSTLVNPAPLTTSTNLYDSGAPAGAGYTVRAVVNGVEQAASPPALQVGTSGHLSLPLQRPAGGTTPDGASYQYHANDASVGDLTGDGRYEIVLKWDPDNSRDNAQDGYTGPVIIDAYTLTGQQLWRVNLGRNIRAGAHYTQFLVYDFDGNGRAEVVFKTADGTVDGQGSVIGNPNADHRNSAGRVLAGPEFLTVFDGLTGAALATTNYHPPRGNVSSWGDNYGNRVDRMLAGVAYLDGVRPSIVMARGYYTRSVLAAYDWRNGQLTQRWVFDSAQPGLGSYSGQGNHQLSVADVDGDGRDEIIYGQMTVDDNGTGRYTTGYGHGDALHVGDFHPNRPGLEIWGVHESSSAPLGFAMRDAATGQTLFGQHTGFDVGRGAAGDIDPRHLGAEAWAVGGAWNSPTGWLYSATGQLISTTIPPANHMIWWDGDPLREILDHDWNEPTGVGYIGNWNWQSGQVVRLLTPTGTRSNNWTKGNPALTADLFGDWREEAIWRTANSNELRIYPTTHVTDRRIPTLMHDSQYRVAIAWQNVAYNQPPHPSFFIGDGMATPPHPNVYTP